MAEEQGFEPWEPLDSSVFKTGAFDHSAIPPLGWAQILPCRFFVSTVAFSFFKINTITVQKTVKFGQYSINLAN